VGSFVRNWLLGYHLTEISAASDRIVRRVDVDPGDYHYVAGTVESLLVADNDVYLAHDGNSSGNGCSREIDKIDATDGDVLAKWTLPATLCDPASQLAFSQGRVWVAQEYSLAAVNSSTGELEDQVQLPKGFEVRMIASAAGRIWAAGTNFSDGPRLSGELVEVDASTAAVVRVLTDDAIGVTAEGGDLWAAAMVNNSIGVVGNIDYSLVDIDPGSGQTIRRLSVPSFENDGYRFSLAAVHAHIFLVGSAPDALLRAVSY
jgi:hypothetical protein